MTSWRTNKPLTTKNWAPTSD